MSDHEDGTAMSDHPFKSKTLSLSEHWATALRYKFNPPRLIYGRDVESYLSELHADDLTNDDKAELLIALWNLIYRFGRISGGGESGGSNRSSGSKHGFTRRPSS